jgi:D-alanyl-D-alanine carboxypeptidase/D-alanyl-D-alanine-endopeptidase (penicillin-binding protein 4)
MIRPSALVRHVVLAIAIISAEYLNAAELNDKIATITGRKEFQQAHWGMLVVDLESGQTLFEHQPDQLFAPASVTKLFSVAAALDELGADYRFKTPVFTRGTLSESGVLDGDLILVGQGDLSFGGRTDEQGKIAFQNVDHTYATPINATDWTQPDPLGALKDLARQIAAAGVKQVRGEITVDDRLYDHAESTGSGPRRLSPIMLNDNLMDVRVTAAAEPGKPAHVEWRPQGTAFLVDAQVDTGDAKSGPLLILRNTAGGLIVRGSVPAGSPTRVVVHEFDNSALATRALFIDCLRSAGVKVNASPLWAVSVPLPAWEDYSRQKPLAVHTSPPFSESAKLILKVSHNLQASTLPLLLATRHKKRTLDSGLQLQAKFLAKAGIDVDTISFGGGAGGDRGDYATPAATVTLLQYMAKHRDFAAYREALPILGVDGTLAKVVRSDSPARGQVRAKTGTFTSANRLNQSSLLLSKALGGYAECRSGRAVAFAMFVNLVHLDKKRDTAAIGSTLGELCEVIVDGL